jgi:hypothetical protein
MHTQTHTWRHSGGECGKGFGSFHTFPIVFFFCVSISLPSHPPPSWATHAVVTRMLSSSVLSFSRWLIYFLAWELLCVVTFDQENHGKEWIRKMRFICGVLGVRPRAHPRPLRGRAVFRARSEGVRRASGQSREAVTPHSHRRLRGGRLGRPPA